MSTDKRKTLCVDFDGVLHSYRSGWKGARVIPDPPMPGAIEWLKAMIGIPERFGAFGLVFDVCIFSSRSRYWGGRRAMKRWLLKHGLGSGYLEEVRFPWFKPAAHLLVDDRCWRFAGTFPSVAQVDCFEPHKAGQRVLIWAGNQEQYRYCIERYHLPPEGFRPLLTPDALRGVHNVHFVCYGTWYERENVQEMRDALSGTGAVRMDLGQFIAERMFA